MQPVQDDVLMVSETLDKLLARDTVQVELIPEKKGLFLKHVEYQVTSQVSTSLYGKTLHNKISYNEFFSSSFL